MPTASCTNPFILFAVAAATAVVEFNFWPRQPPNQQHTLDERRFRGMVNSLVGMLQKTPFYCFLADSAMTTIFWDT